MFVGHLVCGGISFYLHARPGAGGVPTSSSGLRVKGRTVGNSTLHTFSGREHFVLKLGTEVKVLVVAHYFLSNSCLAFVDFERGRFVHTGPHFDFVEEHRDCGPTARRRRAALGLSFSPHAPLSHILHRTKPVVTEIPSHQPPVTSQQHKKTRVTATRSLNAGSGLGLGLRCVPCLW